MILSIVQTSKVLTKSHVSDEVECYKDVNVVLLQAHGYSLVKLNHSTKSIGWEDDLRASNWIINLVTYD
jgi:hypothetical protein